jgi:hypothetical protein
MEEGASADGRMQMAGIVHVADSDGRQAGELRLLTRITTGSSGPMFDPVWQSLPGSSYAVGLVEIQRNNDDPTKSTGTLAFYDTAKPMPVGREEFTVEFSDKPLISLVWFGVIAMVTGFCLSIGRALSALKKKSAMVSPENTPST